MKKIFVSFIFAALCLSANAQSPIGKGGTQFNFGVGLYGHGVPVYAGLDFGVHPDITIGPQVGLDLNFDYLSISGRGDYHFNSVLDIPRDWDFYAGLNIGFAIGFDHDHDHHGHHNHHHVDGLDLGLQIGGRYYWSSGWGINLEFGGGNNLNGGRFGLSKRF